MNHRNGTQCQCLLNITAEHSLNQMIIETMNQSESSKSLNDLFLTIKPSLVINIFHMTELCVCKHETISLEINSHAQKLKSLLRKALLFRKIHLEGTITGATEFCKQFQSLNRDNRR